MRCCTIPGSWRRGSFWLEGQICFLKKLLSPLHVNFSEVSDFSGRIIYDFFVSQKTGKPPAPQNRHAHGAIGVDSRAPRRGHRRVSFYVHRIAHGREVGVALLPALARLTARRAAQPRTPGTHAPPSRGVHTCCMQTKQGIVRAGCQVRNGGSCGLRYAGFACAKVQARRLVRRFRAQSTSLLPPALVLLLTKPSILNPKP